MNIDYKDYMEQALKQVLEANALLEAKLAEKYAAKMVEADVVYASWVETGETDHLTEAQKAMLTIQ